MLKFSVSLVLLLFVFNCALFEDEHSEIYLPTPIILISMDGFRWDYIDRTETPNLDYVVSEGVHAEALIPVYPSTTFPNHLSIVTGCYPENHGIVSNRMWDPIFQEWYYIGEGAEPVQDGKWYEAEPIWVTAEKAGLTTAVYHWPGSETEIMGYHPSEYFIYDGSVTNEEKIEQVLLWLDQSENERPSFIATYFNEANYYGHRLGVSSIAIDSVIQGLDQNIGQLITGLEQRDLLNKVNIIIVSDHGMVDLDEEKIIFIDDYISLQNLERYRLGPAIMLDPVDGELESVYSALINAHPNLSIYKKEETPEHLHYRDHRRISSIIGIPDESWYVLTRSYYDNNGLGTYVATHGYDPTLYSMQGIFLAVGPDFQKGHSIPKFENIHIYNLLTNILGITGVENDGDFEEVKMMIISD